MTAGIAALWPKQAASASQPLHSAQWFRVAHLRPLLQPQVQVQRMVQRGEVWHTLVHSGAADAGAANHTAAQAVQGGSGAKASEQRSFRLNAAAWSAVARCDGACTLQQVWDSSLAQAGPHASTQDELLAMLARLHEARLMSFDRSPDFGAQLTPASHANANAPDISKPSSRHRQSLLAWRLPLGNPNALLLRLLNTLRLVGPSATACPPQGRTTSIGLTALLVCILMAVGLACGAALFFAAHLSALLQPLLAAPSSWGLAWLAYPVVKLLHELAHGLVARSLGAAVPQWGITFLMGVPVPYVDASAASALPQRRQRLLVASAGMAAELLVAALALLVALAVQPGTLRDTALLVAAMAVLSTCWVNANPLLRFDGYHMLCDALALPNLGPRSSQHWLQQLRGDSSASQPGLLRPAPGEAPWLWVYAPAALAMRCTVAVAVVLWLGQVSQWLGLLAAAGFGGSLLLRPLLRLLAWLRAGGWQQLASGAQGRVLSLRQIGLLGGSALLLAALLWPVPASTVMQGVLLPPAHTQLRAQAPGFVQRVWVLDGQAVVAGDPVLQLHAPELQAQQQQQRGRVQDLQAQQMNALRDDPATAAAATHALQAALSDLALTEERLQQLTLRAPVSGRISIERLSDLPGRHLARGALLAHVLTGQPGTLTVAIGHEQVHDRMQRGQTVQVLGPEPGAQPLMGRWVGKLSGGQTQLPSAALGQRSGGRLAVDAADPQGLRPAQPVLFAQVELALDDRAAASLRLGQRMWVRMEQGHAPLALQAARAVQQALLRHFNPAV